MYVSRDRTMKCPQYIIIGFDALNIINTKSLPVSALSIVQSIE